MYVGRGVYVGWPLAVAAAPTVAEPAALVLVGESEDPVPAVPDGVVAALDDPADVAPGGAVGLAPADPTGVAVRAAMLAALVELACIA